jgi:hypothetical protein
MKTKLPILNAIFTLLILCYGTVTAQSTTTVFSDSFTTSAGTSYTTAAGLIGSNTNWRVSRSGTDFGSRIDAGVLSVTDDATTAGNSAGWAMAYTDASLFTSPYNTNLTSNSGDVTWTFNMRQPQANPGGFASGSYGVAFILAGTTGTTSNSGSGYAVTLGNSGKTDPLKLVRYTSGLQTTTTLVTSNTSGLTDFGNPYISVKVIYSPSTNNWQLFVRNDGGSFLDPNSGSLTLQGASVNNPGVTALPIMGGFWSANTKGNQAALFDNLKVIVAVPSITSLVPPSKVAGTGAFTLTVNGTGFISGTSVVNWNGSPRTTTFVSSTQITAAVLATDITSSGTASVTVLNGAAVSNTQTFTIDVAGAPVMTLSTNSLTAMTTVTGTTSAVRTYTISGSNLTADVIVTAPTNFEISSNGTTYAGTLTLTRTGNVLVGQPITISARVKSSAPAGIYSESITHTTTGGTSKSVAVSATVISVKPTTQATLATIPAITTTSTTFTVNWTNGNGANHLVLIRSGNAVNSAPVDGNSYSAVSSFGAGSEIGTGNYVIYAGSSNTISITGLQPSTVYHVAVYDFNGSGGTESYLTTTPATANRTTLNAPVGWQIYTANTTNTISFDTTVDGVNEGIYQAEGMSPTLSVGELNSNAWAVTGFSDGAIAFGNTSTDGLDYDRGTAAATADTGGMYAFETSANNYSLGIQQATGDFVPGSVTLRFQNQTGSAITSLSIGYKVYVYNSEAASSSLNFSHSSDNSTYTTVSGLAVTSPATADVTPGWKAYYRVVTLTGISVANNNYYYLRWTGAAVSGSVDFDAFALDDIVMVANPSTAFASFSGTAESFNILGNATLSGVTTVANDLTFNGGKLDINGNTLNINGTVTNTTPAGLKGSAASNIGIGGAVSPSLSFDQTTVGTTNLLNNFSINTTAANTVTLLNPVVVNGTLTTAAAQTLNLGINALTGTLTAIANNGTITTQNTTSTPIPSGKTWSGTGTIQYNAASAQTAVTGTYQNLTISGVAGAVAAGSFTINGILNLPTSNPSSTVGSLTMGSFTLTMGGSATNAGVGDVTGAVTRNSIVANTLYTFGQTNTSILFPATGTLPTSMSLKIAIGTAPSWRTGAINRTYDFIQTGGSATKAVIKAHYLDSELNGNAESKLVDWSYIVPSNTVLEQGRSNYNTIDNWIELTNVNVGLYFVSSFGVVLLTLDESAAGSLTWNGSVSDSWTTAVNWTPNATPSDNSTIYIPDAATTPNDPTVNPLVLLGAINIEPGGIVNAPAGSQFTVNGGAGAWINNGTYNPGTGTSAVIFTSADATIAGITDFNNLTINSGASLRPLTDNIMRIAGQFTISGTLTSGAIENIVEFTGTGQTIPNPNGPSLNAYHNLIISGTGTIFPSSLNIAGDLTLNQSIDFTGKTVVMTGAEAQNINGTSTPAFNNLTINNTIGDVTLQANTSVNGTLTLTSGSLILGANNLTLGSNAVAGTFSSTRMIVANGTGEVRRTFAGTGSYTFPIGDATNTIDYSPITVSVTSGSFSSAYVGVSVVDAIHPNNMSAANNLSRYWKVNESGITGAVATITATYVPEDLTGAETSIGAAQLNGTFNQSSNPWIKYATLGSSTLTATNATLTAGQTSAFTGIKGAVFTATIMGYGSFCQNQGITLNGVATNGDMPYTYLWSDGLGTQATAAPSTATVGSVNYTLTIKDSNGITATDSAVVITLAPSQGGTVSSSQNICSGSTPTSLVLSGNTGSVVHWQSSSDIGFSSPVNISNITNTLTAVEIGPLTATTYYRAVVQNGSCSETFSSVVSITIRSTTWNGTAWSNGVPDSTTTAVISGNYTSTGSISACTLTVNNSAIVTIASGHNVTLDGALTVSSGSFTLENNANLLQTQNVANSGNIIVKRNSSALKRQDYTLWSSPVEGQNLLAFSPLTVTTRFYTYNSSANIYAAVTPSTTSFAAGSGYLIRMPNNHPTTATIWNGQFTGVPRNGNYPVVMSNTYNLVGNPYPSPISMSTFVAENTNAITGTLYFWRETNNNTTNNAYCTWAGGTFTSNGETQVVNPNGIIETGQGFFVAAKAGQSSLNFNNTQRVSNFNNQFFRNASTEERHTIWLNATNAMGAFSQMAVGYITDATQGIDLFDGKAFADGDMALTSTLDNEDYAIQGRALPFDASDIVPLGFRAAIAGDYVFSIDHAIGLFSADQPIYIKDNLMNVMHNLKESNYTFASGAGTFNNRFELVYQETLATTQPQLNASGFIVYKQNHDVVINSGKTVMAKIAIYDIRGRLLVERTNVNATEIKIPTDMTNQVLVIKITSDQNETITKKVVN